LGTVGGTFGIVDPGLGQSGAADFLELFLPLIAGFPRMLVGAGAAAPGRLGVPEPLLLVADSDATPLVIIGSCRRRGTSVFYDQFHIVDMTRNRRFN
jgi:hypothetical protein